MYPVLPARPRLLSHRLCFTSSARRSLRSLSLLSVLLSFLRPHSLQLLLQNRSERTPGYEERASIRQEAQATFNMVCDLETPQQWAEGLRVPLAHAARMGNADLVDKLVKAGVDLGAGFNGHNDEALLHAAAGGRSEEVVSTFVRAEAEEDMGTTT